MLALLIAEWRYVSIVTFLGFIYHNIYHTGYESCEIKVNKAVQEAQLDADKRLKTVQDENKVIKDKNTVLQGELNAKIKNQPNSPISNNIIKLLNQIAK